jgi:hypothetical protein
VCVWILSRSLYLAMILFSNFCSIFFIKGPLVYEIFGHYFSILLCLAADFSILLCLELDVRVLGFSLALSILL